MKEIDTQAQKAQIVPYRINPRRNIPRHMLIKLTKTKHKERIIKSNEGKATNNIQGDLHKDNSGSFSKNSEGQKRVAGYN